MRINKASKIINFLMFAPMFFSIPMRNPKLTSSSSSLLKKFRPLKSAASLPLAKVSVACLSQNRAYMPITSIVQKFLESFLCDNVFACSICRKAKSCLSHSHGNFRTMIVVLRF